MSEDQELQIRLFESKQFTETDEASIQENCYHELAEILKAPDAEIAITIAPATLKKVEQKMKDRQRQKTIYKKAISALIFILVMALSLQFLWQADFSWKLFSQMLWLFIPFSFLITLGWLIDKRLNRQIHPIKN